LSLVEKEAIDEFNSTKKKKGPGVGKKRPPGGIAGKSCVPKRGDVVGEMAPKGSPRDPVKKKESTERHPEKRGSLGLSKKKGKERRTQLHVAHVVMKKRGEKKESLCARSGRLPLGKKKRNTHGAGRKEN